MKTLFPGYYPYTNEQVKSFIEDSTVVFGASVLLDLYRISNWSVFLNLVKTKIGQNRLWLPYDTAWLYHNRMPDVIDEQIESVRTALKYLNLFKEAIESPFGHPFISNELMTRFGGFIEDATKALDDMSRLGSRPSPLMIITLSSQSCVNLSQRSMSLSMILRFM